MVSFWVGIKSGIVSGAITGVIFAIVVSVLFYSISASTSDSLTNLQLESSKISGISVFGKTAASSLLYKILIYSGITIMIGILVGLMLGVAAAAIIKITKLSPAYSMAILAIIALAAYYSQTYGILIELLAGLRQQSALDNNLKILSILINVLPPTLFALVECLLLKYFLGVYTVVKLERATVVQNPNYAPPAEQNNSNQTRAGTIKIDAPLAPSAKQFRQLPGTGTSLQKNIPEDLKNCIHQCVDKELPDTEIISVFQEYGYDSAAAEAIIKNRHLQNYERAIKPNK